MYQPVAYVKEKPLPLEKPLFLNLIYIWFEDECKDVDD